MAGLLNGKRDLKLPWQVNDKTNEHQLRQILHSFKYFYTILIDEREVKMKSRSIIHILPKQFQLVVTTLVYLWENYSIIETFLRRNELTDYFVENIPYFMHHIHRISHDNYMPNQDDILHCRRATSGIIQVEFNIRQVPFQFIDVGGQRTQRQKWYQCFSDVTAIQFIVSCSEFDEKLREDGKTNRMQESCKVGFLIFQY
jgi:guanine nucleotide-binding protein subunit alpha-12